jgi:hypothetical protein
MFEPLMVSTAGNCAPLQSSSTGAVAAGATLIVSGDGHPQRLKQFRASGS